MFTGIIEEVGTVADVTPLEGGRRLRIDCSFADALRVDESVAVDGVCLTVVAQDAAGFEATAVEETLSKTALGDCAAGDGVNLERALKAGDELGGHIVSGHVDGMAELVALETEGESLKLTFRAPDALAPFIAAKGSVTLDGVSLTVNTALARDFTVNIIPHTQEQTTLGGLAVGGAVNLEIDMLARYVARLMQTNGEAP